VNVSSDRTAKLVLTVSATYGSGGSVVAPALARALGVPFFGRLASPGGEQSRLTLVGDRATTESINHAERSAVPGAGYFGRLIPVVSMGLTNVPPAAFGDREAIRKRSEDELVRAVECGGVILGRAGAVVLALNPSAYHVRLDGPRLRRVARGAEIEEIGAAEATERMNTTDRLREQFTRRLYGADWADSGLYHLVIDTTVLDLDTVVKLMADTAMAFWARAGVDELPALDLASASQSAQQTMKGA